MYVLIFTTMLNNECYIPLMTHDPVTLAICSFGSKVCVTYWSHSFVGSAPAYCAIVLQMARV